MYNKPQTKPMLMPIINESSTAILIGGFQENIARELEVDDPNRFIELLKFLDGTQDKDSICDKFSMDDHEFQDLMTDLHQNGIIQENNPNIVGFHGDEECLFSRNINFFSWIDIDGVYYNYWETQKKLKNSKILLLGGGGTGSNCANSLARLGIGEITIVDIDKIELSNLNRQLFAFDDIGEYKSIALSNNLKKINPFIKTSPIVQKINTLNDLISLGDSFDLVVCCIDTPNNINSLVDDFAVFTGIPAVLGSYANTVITSSIFSKNSVRYKNVFLEGCSGYVAKSIHENEFWQWDNSAISPVVSISGCILTMLALYQLVGLGDVRHGVIHHMDMFNIHNNAFSYYIPENKKPDIKPD